MQVYYGKQTLFLWEYIFFLQFAAHSCFKLTFAPFLSVCGLHGPGLGYKSLVCTVQCPPMTCIFCKISELFRIHTRSRGSSQNKLSSFIKLPTYCLQCRAHWSSIQMQWSTGHFSAGLWGPAKYLPQSLFSHDGTLIIEYFLEKKDIFFLISYLKKNSFLIFFRFIIKEWMLKSCRQDITWMVWNSLMIFT